LAAKSGTTSPWALTLLVPQAQAAIPGKVSRGGEEPATLNGKSVRVQKYTLEFANLMEEFWADATTNELMRVHVPIQDVELVRVGFALAPKPEAKDSTPAAFVERNVEFPSGSLKFPATLCLPAKQSAQVPIIVLVHGSGPNDRDESIGPNKPFRDIAHGLAAAGIGTLRYDKRTFAFKGQLNLKTLTVEEETIVDAVAALQFARTLTEADSKHVFVLGHSQGATFAPVIADRAQAQGAILMAAAQRSFDQMIPEQVAFQLKLAGKSQEEIDSAIKELKTSFARVRSGEAKDDESVFFATAYYWRDLLNRDPQAALKNTRVPVLLLQGGKDVQVLKADYDLAQQAVASKPPEMREAHFYANLNHLFLPVEGQSTGAEYGVAAHIPQEVIDTIAAWLHKRAGQ
jgi:pimeloyl-ACP methyl ester carboxylesterase